MPNLVAVRRSCRQKMGGGVQTHKLWNFYKYVRYNSANKVSTFSMSGTILPTMCHILVVIV